MRIETDVESISLGHPLLDDYLAFVGARAQPNTRLAVAFDLKVFFSVIAKDSVDVTPADVFTFLKEQRSPRRGVKVVRLEDGEVGLSFALSGDDCPVSGLFGYLIACGDAGVTVIPFPEGLPRVVREGALALGACR